MPVIVHTPRHTARQRLASVPHVAYPPAAVTHTTGVDADVTVTDVTQQPDDGPHEMPTPASMRDDYGRADQRRPLVSNSPMADIYFIGTSSDGRRFSPQARRRRATAGRTRGSRWRRMRRGTRGRRGKRGRGRRPSPPPSPWDTTSNTARGSSASCPLSHN